MTLGWKHRGSIPKHEGLRRDLGLKYDGYYSCAIEHADYKIY